MFWSGDGVFFPGIITAFDKASLSHRVTYDEGGEHHWLRLWREGEVIRVRSFRGDEDDDEDDGDKENAKENERDDAPRDENEGTPGQKGEQEVKLEPGTGEELPPTDTHEAMDVDVVAEEGATAEEVEGAEEEVEAEPPLPPLPPQLEDVPCLVCGRLDGEEDFVLCDACPSGGHYRCLQMDAIPTGEWYCEQCVSRGRFASRTRRRRRMKTQSWSCARTSAACSTRGRARTA